MENIISQLGYLYNLTISNVYIKFSVMVLGLFVIASLATPLIFWILGKLVAKTKTNIDDKLFDIVKPPVFRTIVLSGIILSLEFSGLNIFWQDLLQKIVYSLLIFVWARPLSKASSVILTFLSTKKRSFVKKETLPLFRNMSFILLWSLAIYFIFAVWGISLTAWLASAGIVGIAVGFAAKDTLANLISGIFILADSPYKVGDIIRLDSGDKGEVLHVGLRSTRIKTFDGVEVTIPNANIANGKIMNETGTHIDRKMRVRIPLGVAYDSDINEVESILLKLADNDELVCEEPAPQVRFISFGESSLDLELRVWVESPSFRGRVLDNLNRKILDSLREAGIEIPYPKRDVYLKKDNE